jgi:threonine/homoserine/homoserine lactone efflux protein
MAGACYLVWIGIKSLIASWKGHGGTFQVTPSMEGKRRNLARSFREGLLTNVLNPKVAIFYLTFLPQFVSPEGSALRQSLLLALIHIAMGFLWLSSYAFFFDKISSIFLRDAVRKKLEVATGVVLMAMGVRLALEKR